MNLAKADEVCIQVQNMVYEKIGKGRMANSFVPHSPSECSIRDDGIVYVNDLAYGKTYPNSFLDIWYPDQDKSILRPTVVYFHGGGFLFGDKVGGDPLSIQNDSLGIFQRMLQEGFNVVSANYAHAPEYRFPVQVHQVNEIMEFLLSNEQKLHLDMSSVVLMGGSAGANLTEIYGLVVADKEYAHKLNISPSLRKEQLKALVIDEAALSVKPVDENMEIMGLTWLGEDDLKESEKGKLLVVPEHIKGSYIPTFVNSSNHEPWFVESSIHLITVLEKYKLPFEHYYKDPSFGELKHGYMNEFKTNIYARECLDQMLTFIKKYSFTA